MLMSLSSHSTLVRLYQCCQTGYMYWCNVFSFKFFLSFMPMIFAPLYFRFQKRMYCALLKIHLKSHSISLSLSLILFSLSPSICIFLLFLSSLSLHISLSPSLIPPSPLSLSLFPLLQLYDLGSPSASSSTAPGCSLTDGNCMNMGVPVCGARGRCNGQWDSFSCQCGPGYTGIHCEDGMSLEN